jgi:hypothetical protein
VRAALDLGDCGYPHKGELGEVFTQFAADRLGWSPDRKGGEPRPAPFSGVLDQAPVISAAIFGEPTPVDMS